MGQRIKGDGTGLIGAPFTIFTLGGFPSVAYNDQTNEYLVTATIFSNIIGLRVDNIGTVIGSPVTLISKTNSIYSKIIYNTLANNYLLVAGELTDLGNDQSNIKIFARKITANGQPDGNELLLRDQGHGNYSDGARFSVAYAPIISTETPSGRYLLAIKEPTDLTMLDHNGFIVSKMYDPQQPGLVVDDHIPFQGSKVGSPYNIDVAFGNFEGEDIFMVVWGDLNKQLNGLDRRGIWAGVVPAIPIEYEVNGVSTTVFPILNYGLQHSINKTDAKTWKPKIAYNKAAYKFMIAWRELPTTFAGNDTKVNHIRAAAVYNSTSTPDNVVLSAITGSENPMNPTIVSSTKNSNAFVAWEDSRNFSTKDIDLYGNLFTTTPGKALVLTSPNGGEIWQEGTEQQITWESAGIGITDVRIEYSIDHGASFSLIANKTNADGGNSYNWTVPNTPSTQCIVQITADGLSDQSDELFTIPEPGLTIIEPNGGETWYVGSTHDIWWNNYNFSDNVKIEYSTDGGVSYSTIISSTSNSGTYSWIVPDTPSSNCLVRVTDAFDGNPSDVSDAVFTIVAAKLTLTAPNFYENWVGGTKHVISWLSQGLLNYDVTIEFSTDNGHTYQFIDFHTNVQPTESYEWTVPNLSITDSYLCFVRISVNIQGVEIVDTSDKYFYIQPLKKITIISPNGGEVWKSGSQQEIKWSSTLPSSETVQIGVFVESDLNYYVVANVANDGSYTWNIEDQTFPPWDKGRRWIDISYYGSEGTEYDRSDTYFTIIQNTSPGDNVNVDLGEGIDITFDSVDREGTTTLKVTQTGTPPPNSFIVSGSPNYYNIETTAEFTGNLKICINYDDTGMDPYEESALALLVYETPPGQWKDITTSLDIANNIICGEVNHLSEFAIMMPTSDPQVYIVTNTNDSGEGSFRNAIDSANANIEADTIKFNIPKTDPNYDATKGVWYIRPTTYYQSLLDSGTVIDGTSQRIFIDENTNPEGPEIVFDGSQMSTNNGCLSILANNIEIYELTINNFKSTAVSFWNSDNGIISGCYIGTDNTGMTSVSNFHGITMGHNVNGTLIGPSMFLQKPNVISGNLQDGIFISDSCQHNLISGNYIGVNKNATDTIQNKLRGIDLSRGADNNTIIGNYIGGNYQGIYVYESNENLIRNNIVGTNESWEYDLSNSDGILVFNSSSRNIISENIVGYNKGSGIIISGNNSTGNKISKNYISKNLVFGIDNYNGGNLELSPPVIVSVSNNEISGTAGANQIIEIFADSTDEGKVYIDSTVSDASGNFSLTISALPLLPNITSTARDDLGNTSEFSLPFIVTDIEEVENVIPTEYALFQNYPNPFNPSTVIKYQIPVESFTSIKVYDAIGKEVETLVNEPKQAGIYTVEWNSSNQSSGIYFYKITSGNFTAVRKMLFIK